MQKYWLNKKVNLELLTGKIIEYLKSKDFEIVKIETKTGYYLLADDSPHFRNIDHVSIAINYDLDGSSLEVEVISTNVSLLKRNCGDKLMPLCRASYELNKPLRI